MCKPYCESSIPNSLILSKTISYTKYPILLVKNPADASEYIIKAYAQDLYSRSSYLKEKKILSSVNHPNIIQYIQENLFEVSIPQRACIMMEYAPYGDFFNLVIENNFNEMLVRTYFHQLIQGLEHLHSRGIAHLDVKLENLLLGKDLQLKIADFDMSQSIKDENVLSQGSENYRAPELLSGHCTDFRAADVYSAGICLFILMSKAFPFIEESESLGELRRYDDFLKRNGDFWNEFENLLKNKIQFSQNLRELLNGMWKENPKERLNLKKIKESRWFNEPTYNKEELKVAIQTALRK